MFLNNLRRLGSIDELRLLELCELLKSMILSQSAELEREATSRGFLSTNQAGNINAGLGESKSTNSNTTAKDGKTTSKRSLDVSKEESTPSSATAPKRMKGQSSSKTDEMHGKHEKEHHDDSKHRKSKDKHSEPPIFQETLPDEVLRPVLMEAWKSFSLMDDKVAFALPVTDEIAPGYSAEIDNPMDLSTVVNRINKGKYKAFHAFDKDLQLICTNCVQYNDAKSVFGKVCVLGLSSLYLSNDLSFK
jgi:hypothetical protein